MKTAILIHSDPEVLNELLETLTKEGYEVRVPDPELLIHLRNRHCTVPMSMPKSKVWPGRPILMETAAVVVDEFASNNYLALTSRWPKLKGLVKEYSKGNIHDIGEVKEPETDQTGILSTEEYYEEQ